MADENKTTFPVIPEKHWWSLRGKFKQSIPTNVTAGYIAASLAMNENSAKSNVLPSLLMFKIIDKDGKPSDLAKRWRDDEDYPKVCEEIRSEIYPNELLEALPPPTPNRDAVERWFANKTGVGAAAAKRMAVIYELLCDANPNGAGEINNSNKPKTPKAIKTKPLQQDSKQDANDAAKEQPAHVKPHAQKHSAIAPTIHINIQIHIAADSTANQIDHIFASMAKHLGNLARGNDEQGTS